MIISPFIAFLLLAPVVVCNYVDNLTTKVFIMIAATGFFVCCMSFIMKAKSIDLAVAGATHD